MRYIEFLSRLHEIRQPERYFEIGVRWGESISLARCDAIGVDPEFRIDRSLVGTTRLLRTTSDDFFENHDLPGLFGGKGPDMSFIDGMHLTEYA